MIFLRAWRPAATNVLADRDLLGVKRSLLTHLSSAGKDGEPYFRARNRMAALALTPALPEVTLVGVLSALLRRGASLRIRPLSTRRRP